MIALYITIYTIGFILTGRLTRYVLLLEQTKLGEDDYGVIFLCSLFWPICLPIVLATAPLRKKDTNVKK